jgi:hypothetical protein
LLDAAADRALRHSHPSYCNAPRSNGNSKTTRRALQGGSFLPAIRISSRATRSTTKIGFLEAHFTVDIRVMRTFLLVSTALCCLFFSCRTTHAGPPARFQGTGSCSSSNCHGSVNPIKGSRVLQNEYYTWLKHDSHSKAFTALTQPNAKKMAQHLGLGDPTKEPQCLACHTTYVPNKEQRGERYTIEDGVSCESCHGAAEHWLAPHAAAQATHDQNIQNGLIDTVNLENRAKLCLSCHQGDETKRVTHDLYGAGHPRLRFELDTYGILQPKHWIVDEDYRSRKEDYIPIKAWLVGQIVQAQGFVAMLKNPHVKGSGLLPELSVFDCYSCHHSLSQSQWKDRSYGGKPGQLHLNLTPLILVEQSIKDSHPDLAGELQQHLSILDAEYQRDGTPSTVANLAALLGSKVLPAAKRINTDEQFCTSVMRSLAKLGTTQQPLKFELAEQIGMGIQAAAATTPTLSQKHEAALHSLFATIKNADTFSPRAFATALAPWL